MTQKYKLVRSQASKLDEDVNALLANGWTLLGQPFATGNQIRTTGNPEYPASCRYTAEIAQAVVQVAP